MSLLTELRDIADKIDPSLLPSSHEQGALLGALIYRVEHGASFVEDVVQKDTQEVSDYIAKADEDAAADKAEAAVTAPGDVPPAVAPAPGDVTPAQSSDGEVKDLQAQIADLQAQLSARSATDSQTVVDHGEGQSPANVTPPPPNFGPGVS